jgi:hypothetical protein
MGPLPIHDFNAIMYFIEVGGGIRARTREIQASGIRFLSPEWHSVGTLQKRSVRQIAGLLLKSADGMSGGITSISRRAAIAPRDYISQISNVAFEDLLPGV